MKRYQISGLSLTPVVCALLLAARVGDGAEPTNVVADSGGPTVMLNYSEETFAKNPIAHFMYFVPLISPTLVDRQTSAGNDEEVGIISYERKISAKSFHVACEFEIRGKGFHKNTFDPAGMIAAHTAEVEKNAPLNHMLDYIQFDGEGFGRIEVEGKIERSIETVTEVNVRFNARGRKSPVTIGLYDVEAKDGQYKYENRSNELVARVNTLAFRRSGKTPRMRVTVASITKAAGSDGVFDRIKGAIANVLLKPPKIDRLGNETMLRFGYAIFKQEPEFTFPKAKNIKEDRTVALPPEG